MMMTPTTPFAQIVVTHVALVRSVSRRKHSPGVIDSMLRVIGRRDVLFDSIGVVGTFLPSEADLLNEWKMQLDDAMELEPIANITLIPRILLRKKVSEFVAGALERVPSVFDPNSPKLCSTPLCIRRGITCHVLCVFMRSNADGGVHLPLTALLCAGRYWRKKEGRDDDSWQAYGSDDCMG